MAERIDAHHHFWQIGKYQYPWITRETPVLDHDFGPAELRPLLDEQTIDRSILVQTIASLDETWWFLELAADNPWIAGVVGWVDLIDPNVGATLDLLSARFGERLVGVRHNLHDEPDDRWILREDVLRGLRAVAERDLAYDLLIRPRHLPFAAELAATIPDLRLVIDHLAKPPIANPSIATRSFDDWSNGLAALAKWPNVYCKLSGMITEADPQRWQPADLRPYIDHAIEAFGVERLMFGSDWPVCLLAGSYGQVVDAVEQNLTTLSTADREQIFGLNAARFYQLHDGRVR